MGFVVSLLFIDYGPYSPRYVRQKYKWAKVSQRQAPPPPIHDYGSRRRPERLTPDHPPPRTIVSPSRGSKRKSKQYPEGRDRQCDRERSRHQDIDREHDRPRDRRDKDRSRDHSHHRYSKRSEHHHRKRSEPPSSEPPAVATSKSKMDNNHKSSVFARISFPEEEISSSKRRKASSSSSAADQSASAAAVTVGTSVHRHSHNSRKEMEVGDYESSDDDRHFKRKP